MRFDEQFIRQVLPDVSVIGTVPVDSGFVVDSRIAKGNDIFVALPGEHYNGHSFVVDALKNGAAGVLIAYEKKEICKQQIQNAGFTNAVIVIVSDPLQALVAMATAWREQFDYPVIGVTGSLGKTSTKEMIAAVLKSAKKSFIVSKGNQNTQIGVALNVLRMRSSHEVAVFEMGVNRRGEMAVLARIVRPTIGVITSIAHCHMEGLGSLQDIALEKRDIFKYFSEKNIGIINGDQQLLSQVSFAHPVIKFGCKTTNQVQARKIQMGHRTIRCTLKIYKKKYEIVLLKPHAGAITNALVAATVGHVLHIPHTAIVEGVQESIIVAGRFERRKFKVGNNSVINDCYNANPESMKAALLAFENIETDAQKVAIIGDMLELGVNSQFWHRQIGRFLRKITSLKRVILVGELVQWTEKTIPLGLPVTRVQAWQEAKNILPEILGDQKALVLVKSSRNVGLLNLVDYFTT